MAKRSRGLSRTKQRVMKPLGTRGNRSGKVKILSSQDSTAVGRPGGFGFKASIESGKASVRRLMVRDPAKGVSNEDAAQHIHFNADPRVDLVDGVQSPSISSSVVNPPSKFGSGARRVLKNKGVNRNLKKR
jgi:hypothetical protein